MFIWFKKLFNEAETAAQKDLKTLSDHIEAEFKDLQDRVTKLEAPATASTSQATSTAAAPSAVASPTKA